MCGGVNSARMPMLCSALMNGASAMALININESRQKETHHFIPMDKMMGLMY
jgi:hypothetical protein